MPSSACIKSANHIGCFFNVGSLLISLFSELVMLWSLVACGNEKFLFLENQLFLFHEAHLCVAFDPSYKTVKEICSIYWKKQKVNILNLFCILCWNLAS